MIITVGTHKGGTGKTTTSVALSMSLADTAPTVLVDGDRQGSASTWWRLAEREGGTWPESLTLTPWREPLTLPPAGLVHAVIDIGPGDPLRFRTALALSDIVVIPVQCTAADVAQVGETLDDVERVAQDRPELAVGVLLTRVKLGTYEATEVPAMLRERDIPVLDTVIPERRAYARMFGTAPDLLGAYGDLFAELTTPVRT